MAHDRSERRRGMLRRVGNTLARTPGAGVILAPPRTATFALAALLRGGYGPSGPGIPRVRLSAALAAQVALDETLLGVMRSPRRYPSERDWERIASDLRATLDLYGREGWLDNPVRYHREPPRLATPMVRRARAFGVSYERLSWRSEFAPHDEEPGAAAWRAYQRNGTAHAWVVRAGRDVPWLVCLHGFGVGVPTADFFAFRAAHLSRVLGLNLIFPVFPLHGPRREGIFSGAELLSHELHKFVIAMAHAMWDVRRVIGWARSQSASPVGVYGMSLGGYVAALLATLEPRLDMVMSGAPISDLPSLLRSHIPARLVRRGEEAGVSLEALQQAFSVVSPLAARPKLPPGGLYVFAGLGDRLATPGQARLLHDHWGTPNILWYGGAHLSFLWSAEVAGFIDDAVSERLLSAGLPPRLRPLAG